MPEVLTGEFGSLLSRPDAHAVLDLDAESPALLVLFGGIAGGVSMPVFEFFRLTEGFRAKKAFLRDPRRGWYQLGIPGIGDSAADVRAFLNAAIERARAERVVMAGASAGGFAALLFGSWCGVDEVLAFSPQTFVDAENRRLAGDSRWPEQIDALHAASTGRSPTLDLLGVLPQDAGKTRYQIHVSTDDPLARPLPRQSRRSSRRRRDSRARARRSPLGQDAAKSRAAPAHASSRPLDAPSYHRLRQDFRRLSARCHGRIL